MFIFDGVTVKTTNRATSNLITFISDTTTATETSGEKKLKGGFVLLACVPTSRFLKKIGRKKRVLFTGTRLTTAIHRRLFLRFFLRERGRLYTGYVLSALLHHLLIFLNLRNRTGKETRRQTRADKRDNYFFSIKKTFHKTLPSYIASCKQIVL